MIQKDKKKHMAVGFVISFAVTAVAVYLGGDPSIGLLAAAVAGAVKEIMDDHGPGQEEFMDFYATTAPGVIPPLVLPWLFSAMGWAA